MVVLEVLAFALMLFTLWRTLRYGMTRRRDMVLPTLIYLVLSVILFLAAFGGDSNLVTDWQTMLMRGLAAVAIVAVVGGYFALVRRARERAHLKESDEQ